MKDNALRDRIQGNWKQLKGGIHHEWGKLTHNDVEEVKGDAEMLVGKIEERYGVTKEEARKQIEHWLVNFVAHQVEAKKNDAAEN